MMIEDQIRMARAENQTPSVSLQMYHLDLATAIFIKIRKSSLWEVSDILYVSRRG